MKLIADKNQKYTNTDKGTKIETKM